MNNFDLSNRTAVITGGAQGFGLAITERFIMSGAKVIIWDIDKEQSEAAIKKINSEQITLLENAEELEERQPVEEIEPGHWVEACPQCTKG